MSQDAPPAEAETYEPPSFLITGTHLSREDLIRQYNAFKSVIPYATIAPELVFERVVSGIANAYTVSRAAEARSTVQAEDTIGPALERIETTIQAARYETRKREDLDAQIARDAGTAIRVQFEQLRHDMAVLSATRTLPLSISESPAPDAPIVKITLGFARAGENVGVRIALQESVDTNRDEAILPWDDLDNEYPEAGSGSVMVNSLNQSQSTTEETISFSTMYKRPPTVICWLTGFDTTEFPLRIRVSATNITENCFTLNVEPATARNVRVSWIAGLPANQIGQFDINGSAMLPGAAPLVSNGYKVTGQRTYSRLAVGIKQVEIGGAPVFPVKLYPRVAKGCDYFDWMLSAGTGDKGMYQLKGVYMFS